MSFRVQIYCEADGIPSPLDPQTIVAANAQAAAEKLTGGHLLPAGPHGKLAATVWREGDPRPQKLSFFRP